MILEEEKEEKEMQILMQHANEFINQYDKKYCKSLHIYFSFFL